MASFPTADASTSAPLSSRGRLAALVGGLLAFAILWTLPPPPGLEPAAWTVTATAALMVVWWITEAVPVAVTAMLPLVLFPILGVLDVKNAAAPYANPLTFLFMGGLIIAQAVERWNLHRRIALHILTAFGTRPSGLIGGFMLTSALLSMWITNTATTVMMLPIVLSVISLLEATPAARQTLDIHKLALALLLGIAYSATIGGLGTLVGTAPNALLAGMMRSTYGIELGFARWMVMGVPLVAIILLLSWWAFCRVLFRFREVALPDARRLLDDELAALGPITAAEKRVAAVFGLTVALWMLRPLLEQFIPGLSDAGIAIIGAVLMFLVPVSLREGVFLLDWKTANRIPWGVLLLFGGGLSLAAAITESGLSLAIGEALSGVTHLPHWAMVAIFVVTVLLLTELTSNTATTATFLPIVGAVAIAADVAPATLMVPATLAASCAFMMPVGTPPNAIVFSSGHMTVADMARAGILINVIASLVVTLAGVTVVEWLFDSAPSLLSP